MMGVGVVGVDRVHVVLRVVHLNNNRPNVGIGVLLGMEGGERGVVHGVFHDVGYIVPPPVPNIATVVLLLVEEQDVETLMGNQPSPSPFV